MIATVEAGIENLRRAFQVHAEVTKRYHAGSPNQQGAEEIRRRETELVGMARVLDLDKQYFERLAAECGVEAPIFRIATYLNSCR
jgi:hypothetical protein